jgi:hypothetical protein
MKKLKSDAFFKHLALIFSVAYILGSFMNMMCIPRYTSNGSVAAYTYAHGNNHTLRSRDFRSTNFLQVIDRSTFDNDQETLYPAPKSLELIFTVAFDRLTSISISPQNSIVYNQRYSYLSFCTFRI